MMKTWGSGGLVMWSQPSANPLRFGAPIVLHDTTFSDNRPARCRKISQAQPLGEGANAVAPLVLDARQTLGSCPCSRADRAVGFGHGPRWQGQRGVRRGNQPWHTIAFGRIDVLFAQTSAAEPVDKAGIIVPTAGDCRYLNRRSRIRPCQRISSSSLSDFRRKSFVVNDSPFQLETVNTVI